jgi:hypothetical protein
MSKDSVKTQIDTDITNKTTSKSISPLNVGDNMKAVVDLIPDTNAKTNGSVIAISGSKVTLQYDINTVNKSGGSEVKLPTTTEIGKEVLFLASNYAGTVSVYVNDAEDIKLSGGINGISGHQGNLQINANEAYRFISLENSYWYFEKIIDIPNNYYQLISERSTDGTLASNSNFKYPTEQAVKTYIDTNSGTQDLQSVLENGNEVVSDTLSLKFRYSDSRSSIDSYQLEFNNDSDGSSSTLAPDSLEVKRYIEGKSSSLSALEGLRLDQNDSNGYYATLISTGLIDGYPIYNLPVNPTGIYTLTTLDNLPQTADGFANDAAAAIGGIAVGKLYHTAGVVKIRLS